MSDRTPVAIKLIQLRFLVGALGERLGWWGSRYTDDVGLRQLERCLPRTALRAALESVTVVARRDHDDRLSPTTVHLFKLGAVQEDTIALHLSRGIVLAPPPASEEDILSSLDELGEPDGTDVAVGPISLGIHSRLRRHAAVAGMARVYAAGARAGERPVPYFELAG